MRCYYCNEEVPNNARECPECGAVFYDNKYKCCPNCDTLSEVDTKYCPECGMDIRGIPSEAERKHRTKKRKKKKEKGPFYTRWWFLILAFLLLVSCLNSILIDNVTPTPQEQQTTEAPKRPQEPVELTTPKPTEPAKEPEPEPELFENQIADKALRDDFVNALVSAGMEPENVIKLEQEKDWANGPRYSFLYSGSTIWMYCNQDQTVESLNLGDIKLYKKGQESFQFSDFKMDIDTNWLKTQSEDYVKNLLNYPNTAKFSWLEWQYGRVYGSWYTVSGEVTAANAYGVTETMSFSLIYKSENEEGGRRMTCIYLRLGDNVAYDAPGWRDEYNANARPEEG